MKKLLTVTLVFVFSLALVLAVGCTKKEEQPAMEGGTESGMEQTMPSDEGTMMADSAATMGESGAPAETPPAEGGAGGE